MSKVIVITGAGSGLGKTLAKRFITDGDSVVVMGRSLEKLEAVVAELGERAVAISCDVGVPQSVKAAFAEVEKQFSKIDVLINNAALVTHGAFADVSDDDIVDSFHTNAIGPMLCSKAAVAMMGRGGQIFNVSSGAVDNNYPGLSIYASSKTALERFSNAIYDELQPQGICVTIVRCGQMIESMDVWENDPAIVALREKALADGWDPRDRPSSTFASVAEAFRALIDLPPDLKAASITLRPSA